MTTPSTGIMGTIFNALPRSWKQRIMLGGAFLPAIAAALLVSFILCLFCPLYIAAIAVVIMGVGGLFTGVLAVAANEATLLGCRSRSEGRALEELKGLKKQHEKLQKLYHQKQDRGERVETISNILEGHYGQITPTEYPEVDDTLVFSQNGTPLNNTDWKQNSFTPITPLVSNNINVHSLNSSSSSSSISSDYSLEILKKEGEKVNLNDTDITCDTHYLPVVGKATDRLLNKSGGGIFNVKK